jgi:flagellar biosynthesis/type III secretory pathway protein FliH
MAAMLDIFDQEKVWDMALKAERREGREEGIEKGREEGREKGREEGAAGIIRICRQMLHLDDQAIIQVLIKEMDLPRDKAAEYLDRHNPSRSLH